MVLILSISILGRIIFYHKELKLRSVNIDKYKITILGICKNIKNAKCKNICKVIYNSLNYILDTFDETAIDLLLENLNNPLLDNILIKLISNLLDKCNERQLEMVVAFLMKKELVIKNIFKELMKRNKVEYIQKLLKYNTKNEYLMEFNISIKGNIFLYNFGYNNIELLVHEMIQKFHPNQYTLLSNLLCIPNVLKSFQNCKYFEIILNDFLNYISYNFEWAPISERMKLNYDVVALFYLIHSSNYIHEFKLDHIMNLLTSNKEELIIIGLQFVELLISNLNNLILLEEKYNISTILEDINEDFESEISIHVNRIKKELNLEFSSKGRVCDAN